MIHPFNFWKEKVLEVLSTRLSPMLTYHNVDHTLQVLEQCQHIAKGEGITNPKELLLLKVAALYHDIGFLFVYNNHEDRGCEIVRMEMADSGLTPDDLDKICALIMATKIPQSPKTHLEQILCDADLDYLGREDFAAISNNLKKEFIAYGIVKDEAEWAEKQILFIQGHEYFTGTSRKLRSPTKQQHLMQLKKEAGITVIT